jgi:hypothetical protein
MPAPAEPPNVRDQLFLIAHDEEKRFRPWINVGAIGIGLAGATVMDLLIANRVMVHGGKAYLVDPYERTLTRDALTDYVLLTVRDMEPTPPLAALLAHLGPAMYDRTLGGLLNAGFLSRLTRRRRANYGPTDPGLMVSIRSKVRYRFNGDLSATIVTDALCALVSAVQLHDALMFHLRRSEVDDRLQEISARIPMLVARDMPGSPSSAIPDVADAVRQAIGDLATAVFR